MKLARLDHVNVRTSRLQQMIDWYGKILAMEPGPRPDFPFGGAWLYCDGLPIVHLVEVQEEPAAIAPKLEHFAISATGLDAFLAHLEKHEIAYEVGHPPGFSIIQVNIHDVDQNRIHIDFPADEAAALTGRGFD